MPKISSLEDSNFTNFFPSKFQQIDITSVSGHCRRARFVWKICPTVAGIKNNLSLSNLIFGGFFAIWSKLVPPPSLPPLHTNYTRIDAVDFLSLVYNIKGLKMYDTAHKCVG